MNKHIIFGVISENKEGTNLCLNSSHIIKYYVPSQKFFAKTMAMLQNMLLGNEESHYSARCSGEKKETFLNVKQNRKELEVTIAYQVISCKFHDKTGALS
jgi:hypothetical protein